MASRHQRRATIDLPGKITVTAKKSGTTGQPPLIRQVGVKTELTITMMSKRAAISTFTNNLWETYGLRIFGKSVRRIGFSVSEGCEDVQHRRMLLQPFQGARAPPGHGSLDALLQLKALPDADLLLAYRCLPSIGNPLYANG